MSKLLRGRAVCAAGALALATVTATSALAVDETYFGSASLSESDVTRLAESKNFAELVFVGSDDEIIAIVPVDELSAKGEFAVWSYTMDSDDWAALQSKASLVFLETEYVSLNWEGAVFNEKGQTIYAGNQAVGVTGESGVLTGGSVPGGFVGEVDPWLD